MLLSPWLPQSPDRLKGFFGEGGHHFTLKPKKEFKSTKSVI